VLRHPAFGARASFIAQRHAKLAADGFVFIAAPLELVFFGVIQHLAFRRVGFRLLAGADLFQSLVVRRARDVAWGAWLRSAYKDVSNFTPMRA
jgi:hypothetical protein